MLPQVIVIVRLSAVLLFRFLHHLRRRGRHISQVIAFDHFLFLQRHPVTCDRLTNLLLLMVLTVGVRRDFVPSNVPFELLLHSLVEIVLRNGSQFIATLCYGGIVMTIQDMLGALPEDDLFSHDFLAIVAQVLQRSLFAAARRLWQRLCFWIAFTKVFKFYFYEESVDRKFLEVLVGVFWTYLPAIYLDCVIFANKSCIE